MGGSAVSAVAAFLCCLGPLATLAFGWAGFAGAAFLTKWRPAFLGVTFALLALAWYQTYRKPTNAACESRRCAIKPTVKWTRIILWFTTVFVLATATFPNWSGAVAQHLESRTQISSGMPVSQLATLRVRVPLMDCDACAILIQNKLRNQTGIQNAIVTFRTKAAVVRYNPAEVTARNIMNLIDETGFKAEPTTP